MCVYGMLARMAIHTNHDDGIKVQDNETMNGDDHRAGDADSDGNDHGDHGNHDFCGYEYAGDDDNNKVIGDGHMTASDDHDDDEGDVGVDATCYEHTNDCYDIGEAIFQGWPERDPDGSSA